MKKRRDLKLLKTISLLKTEELVGELKRRGVFCVEGEMRHLSGAAVPNIVKPKDKVVIVVARKD